MRCCILLLYLVCFSTGCAQDELTIFRVEHRVAGSCEVYNALGDHLGAVPSFRHSTDVEMNVGSELNKNNEFALNIEYRNVGACIIDNPDSDILIDMINLPSHSFLSVSGVLITECKKNWVLTNSLSMSFVDDFQKENYELKVFGGVSSFLRKDQTPRFSWGGGVFMNQLAGRIQFFPLIFLRFKNEKRGIELSFPEQLRIWQRLNSKSYLQLRVQYNSFSLSRMSANQEDWFNTNANAFRANLSYQYLYKEFLRFTAGIGGQVSSNLITNAQGQYTYSQFELPALHVGIAWIFIENN